MVGPGYVLDATLPGFRRVRHDFELREPRDWDRAITLQVGDVRETVFISASRVTAPDTAPARSGPQRIRVGGNVRPPRARS